MDRNFQKIFFRYAVFRIFKFFLPVLQYTVISELFSSGIVVYRNSGIGNTVLPETQTHIFPGAEYIYFQGPNTYISRGQIHIFQGTKHIYSRGQIHIFPGTKHIYSRGQIHIFQGPNTTISRGQTRVPTVRSIC